MSTSPEMLRFLTQKLKSQTLNEIQPYQPEEDDDHDSGTESDDENAELEDLGRDLDDRSRHDTSSYGSASPLNHPSSPCPDGGSIPGSVAGARTHEISEHNFDTISCTSDYERQSLDFDRHSSEDELGSINKENVAEKRKWSQVHRTGGHCDSAGSSDEEVKEFLLNPQPVLMSSSPPKGVKKVHTTAACSPKVVLARVAPLAVSTVSPRKRHRQTSTSDTESDSVIQRPCLDFEKMQQKTLMKKHCSHGFGRARIVKIRTVNGGSRAPRSMFDPSIFSFRSISTAYNPLTPVEEPSCAY